MSMGTLSKDESDVAIFSVNWAPRLASGETISTSSWTVGAGLTYVTSGIAAGDVKTTVKVSGGSPGQVVGCINTVTTSTGQTLSRSGFVAVRAM